MKKLAIIFICLFVTTGCYNYHDLQEIGIASSLLIDYDGVYLIQAEILKDEDMIEVYDGQGKTIQDALSNIMMGTNQTLYYAHLNAIIITSRVNIKEVIEYFMRNPNVNNNFYVAMTESTDLYEKENFGETILNILERNKVGNFYETSKNLYNENQDMAIPVITKDKKITKVVAYHNLKPTYYLDIADINILKMLRNKTGSTFSISFQDGLLSTTTNSAKTKISLEDDVIKLKSMIEVSLEEYSASAKTNEEEVIGEIEKALAQNIKEQERTFLDNLIKNDTDILGFDNLIYNKKHNVDRDFKTYNYEIEVTVRINKKGQLLR